MSLSKNDTLQQFLNFNQEPLVSPGVSKEEIKIKQAFYQDEVKKLEEKLVNMSFQDKQDSEKLWGSIYGLANYCNSTGDYFIKIDLSDLALPYLEKARSLLDSITREDLKNKKEWKILKIQIMRNLSNYYNNKEEFKKAAACLKKVFNLHLELEKEDIILPGFEFLYIKLSYYSMKEKNWSDTFRYSSHAVNFLEKYLKIKKGIPILDNKPALDDKDFIVVYSKKLVTLSYAYYMLAKSLMKKENNIDAISYLEKAFQVGCKYLGENDKVTLNYKKKLDSALSKLRIQVPKPPESSNLFGTPHQPLTQADRSSKNLELETKKSLRGFNLLSEFMTPSPSMHNLRSIMSNRDMLQGSDRFLSPKDRRPISMASQFSAMGPLSTKNASTVTQNLAESALERDDIIIFDPTLKKGKSQLMLASDLASNLVSRNASYSKLMTPTNLSFLKDNESKTRKRNNNNSIPKKPSISISNNNNYAEIKNALSETDNKQKNLQTYIDEEVTRNRTATEGNSVKVTFRPDVPVEATKTFLSFMTHRPASGKTSETQPTKYSLDHADIPPRDRLSMAFKPQKPPIAIPSRPSRNSIGKASLRPASAAQRLSKFLPKGESETTGKFTLNFDLKPPSARKSRSKSKSKSPPKSRSFSPDFDPDHDLIMGDSGKPPEIFVEWESSIESIKSIDDEDSKHERLTFNKSRAGGKISEGLKSILRSDAKKASMKYGGDTIFTKLDDKGHLSDRNRVEDKPSDALQEMLENSKLDDDKFATKIDIVRSVPKVLAKELMNKKAMKSIKDMAHFRRIEEDAALTIQNMYRTLKKNGKFTSANPEENILSSNELNSMQNTHGKHGESLLEANFDHLPSHNNLDTQSSAKPSRIFRRSIVMKSIIESDKIHIDYLYRSKDDQAHDYIQRKKQKDEDEDEVEGNRSFTIEENFMMPKTEEELTPKIEVIKRNLKNLKSYDISFYGYFFGSSGLWTVRYGGLVEKKGDLYLVFYLCHGTINHPISVKADLTITEKTMFYATIWRVISANLNAYFIREDMFHLKHRLNSNEDRIFLIIKDLKKEQKMNPIFRITQLELESLREMLIKLCFFLETKFILHKKPTGYVYELVKRVENSEKAIRNRQYLVLSKWKQQKQIKKLATQFDPFLYTAEKSQQVVKLIAPVRSYQRLMSGTSNRKSYGILPGGSDSERDEEPGLARANTFSRKESSDFTRTKTRKPKVSTKRTNKINTQRKTERTLTQSDSQIKSEERSRTLEQYKNPFVYGQILFQNVVNIAKHYLLVSVKILFSKGAADEVSEENQLDFLVEVELFGANRWRDQIKVPYKEFMERIKFLNITLKEFMINSGFLAKQRRQLSDFFQNNFDIVESKIYMKNLTYQAKSQTMLPDLIPITANIRSQYIQREEHKTMDKFVHALEMIQNLWDHSEAEKEEEDLTKYSSGDARIKIIGQHDPNFGASENIDNKLQLAGGQPKMEFYNSFKYLQPRRYYIIFEQMKNKTMLRMDYIELGKEAEMRIALYHQCTGTVDFIVIKQKKIQERLLNIMQMESHEMKRKSLAEVFEFQKSLIGNKLLLKEKLKLERFNKKFDITPMNISQILMTHGDEHLPKYRLDIQKHFTKGVINNLGNCYITITTYFINNLYKFDNIYCIKFEILPFTSKTKFYKFLINSKDIKLYLNMDYPLENPYKNWNTIHTIIQNLILKRRHIYSTIELPIKDTKFMLMKYQRYHLTNVASQSLETSSIGAKVVFGNFLQPKIQETHVILQTTKRIQGRYVVITIERHDILHHWSIIVYDPKACRKYVTSIYFSDILNLNPTLLDSLYSSSAVKLDDKRNRGDYSRFTKSYIEVTGESYQSYMKQRDLPLRPTKDQKNLNQPSLVLEERIRLVTNHKKHKNVKPGAGKDKSKVLEPEDDHDPENKNFYEIKFWENVVRHLEFSYTKSGNILLSLDTFKGVMREFIHREVLQTSKTEESLVEIFLENNYKKYTMFQTIHHIALPYVQNHDLFVKVTRLEKMAIYNNRFNLKQVIELYQKENLQEKSNLFKDNKVSFSKIKVLAQYLAYKVKQWNMVTISEGELDKVNDGQSVNRENILPWMSYKLKLNCNFEMISKIDNQRLFVDKQLIFRGTLTIEPLQIVSLVYDEKKGIIIAYLYDVKESWLLKKMIQMKDIMVNIPYIKVMLKQHLHYEVGKRIFEALKNALIVYSFMKKKKVVV